MKTATGVRVAAVAIVCTGLVMGAVAFLGLYAADPEYAQTSTTVTIK